jgi:hypothetical protein
MHQDLEIFLSIAQIAGVFIGFGALISFSHDQATRTPAPLRAVVVLGLTVMLASLLPPTLAWYGIDDGRLWRWIAITGFLLNPEHWAWLKADVKTHPMLNFLFWIVLEVPIQLPLFLASLGTAPELAPAFYLTALTINLFEAAFMLARLVLSRS